MTVGGKLRRARENRGISLPEAAKDTHIKARYLQELEDDHPELLHSEAQARGFLRLYAAFLNLNARDLIAQWEGAEIEPEEPAEPKPSKWQGKMPDLGEPESKETQAEETALPTPARTEPLEWQMETPDFADPRLAEKQAEALAAAAHETPGVVSGVKESSKTAEQPQEGSDAEKQSISQKASHFLSAIGKKVSGLGIFKSLKKEKKEEREEEVEEPAREAQPEPPPAKPEQSSAEIFAEIGAAMREHRLALELSLSDIEHFTNLKRMYLTAIEDGRFNDLPSTVQGRGMLNNYAQFIAMDESLVMERYAEALQQQREERLAPRRKPAQPPVSVSVNLPDWLRRILNPDLIVGGTIILALFGFIIWGASQVFLGGETEPTDAPSISDILQVTQTATPTTEATQMAGTNGAGEEDTPIPGVAVAQLTPTVIATVDAAPLQVYIITHDRAFLQVTVDGVAAYDGRVPPDEVLTYSGNTRIHLLTGNAAALEVYFNQESLGRRLGDVGEVVDITFSLEGLITPTPQPTRTPTPDLRVPAEDEA